MWGEVEVWGEIRSPVLAAPSFNDYIGLTASSTNLVVGEDDEETQAANDLCEKYKPLALKIARRYRGLGISSDELQSAALLGLTVASRKFDPTRGAFGPYAKLWIKGELTRFFKPTRDAMAFGRSELPSVPAIGDDQADDETVPAVTPDLSQLTEREKTILVGRSRGKTLSDLGSELGVSQERIRQIQAKATEKALTEDEKLTEKGKLKLIRALLRRRGYRKPSRPLLPYSPRTYACHTYTQAETEALVESRPEILRITTTEDEKTQRWWMDQRLRWAEREMGGDIAARGEDARRTVDLNAGSGCLFDLTFRDRRPPKHTHWEPKPSRKILHHYANASRLADLRGNKPLRNPRGPYGGPVIHGWGRP
jgi:RNA polymerase sigma factor (sigma-70 family)